MRTMTNFFFDQEAVACYFFLLVYFKWLSTKGVLWILLPQAVSDITTLSLLKCAQQIFWKCSVFVVHSIKISVILGSVVTVVMVACCGGTNSFANPWESVNSPWQATTVEAQWTKRCSPGRNSCLKPAGTISQHPPEHRASFHFPYSVECMHKTWERVD